MSSANLATVFLHSLDIQQAMMEGHSLDHALERDLKNVEDPVLRAAIQAVSYDTVRHLAASWKVIEHFANRPPAQPVTALLETAIARMIEHPDKDFVTVDQAVKAARENPSTRPSAGFINAILRRFGRERDSLMECKEGVDKMLLRVSRNPSGSIFRTGGTAATRSRWGKPRRMCLSCSSQRLP